MKKLLWFIPLLVFVVVSVILFKGLNKTTNNVISPLLNKPAPIFNLPQLMDPQKIYTEKDLLGEITIVNFWATWCPPCWKEHPVLVKIANDYKIRMLGINYKDTPENAKKWLSESANPYYVVLTDEQGKTAIEWGIIAVPETFVVDKQGIVRYKHTGPITLTKWENEIWPTICGIPDNGFAQC
jgi:cytochrome c biogenesis protein CcmG/thiol:disulfide interchange protein DsbE